MRPSDALFFSILGAFVLRGVTCASFNVTIYEAVTFGGTYVLKGSFVLGQDSTTKLNTLGGKGVVRNLPGNFAAVSPYFGDSGCLQINLNGNVSAMNTYVTTKSNFQSSFTSDIIDSSNLRPLNGSLNPSASNSLVLPVNTSETYIFIAINKDRTALADFNYLIFNSESTADTCTGDSYPTLADDNLVPFLEENVRLDNKIAKPLVIISSAKCISFQALAQTNKSLTSLDMTFFVSTVDSSVRWINSIDTNPQPAPYIGAACTQTLGSSPPSTSQVTLNSSATVNATSNATITQNQSCQINLDDLDTNVQYVIWALNGFASKVGTPGDAFLRYKFKAGGSCNTTTFPDPKASTYTAIDTYRMYNTTDAKAKPPSPR